MLGRFAYRFVFERFCFEEEVCPIHVRDFNLIMASPFCLNEARFSACAAGLILNFGLF